MSEYFRIPIETLSHVKDELFTCMACSTPPIVPETGGIGEALAWSLLFEYWPNLLPDLALDYKNAFYNRYFWFKRFTTLKQRRDGYDAGLEQQVFQLLEHTDFEVDWALIDQLDAEAANIAATNG